MTDGLPAPKRITAMQILGGVLVVSLLLGFGAGLARAMVGDEAGNVILAGGGLAALLLGWATMLPYWRRLDEAAREAHKDSWMWGGLVGYTLAAVYAALLVLFPQTPVIDLVGLEPRQAAAGGIMLTSAAMALCYGAAWGIWWMRKR